MRGRKHFLKSIPILSALVCMCAVFLFSNLTVSAADGDRANVPGAPTGYHFVWKDVAPGTKLYTYFEQSDYRHHNCCHAGGCTIHTGRPNCFVDTDAYLVYCEECYNKYGVKISLLSDCVYGHRNVLYYPSYAGYSNYSQYIQDIKSASFVDQKDLIPEYVIQSDRTKSGLSQPGVENGEYMWLCYNGSNPVCNQHIWWSHSHIAPEANTYTVRYYPSGGAGTMADTSLTYDKAGALRANAFTLHNYTFKGWDTDPSADTVVYTNGQSVKNLTSVDGGIVTLYAVWERNPVTLTINPNGGTYAGSTANQTVTSKINTNLTLQTPTKSGQTFAGWRLTAGDGTVNSNTSFTTGKANSTIVAIWDSDLTLTGSDVPSANSYKGAADLVWVDDTYMNWIIPAYKTHYHEGNENTLGGCYTVDMTHKHGGSCYTTIQGNSNTGNDAVSYSSCGCTSQVHHWKCRVCGRTGSSTTRSSSKCTQGHSVSDTPWNHHCSTKKLVCTLPEISVYALGCGQVEGEYEVNADGSYATFGYTLGIDYYLYRKPLSGTSYTLVGRINSQDVRKENQSDLSSYTYRDNGANDLVSPNDVLNLKTSSASGSTSITATWDVSVDRGSPYDYYVYSYKTGTATAVKKSNFATVSVVSGLKGYVYKVDTVAGTTITAESQGTLVTTNKATFTVGSTGSVYYIHVAPVDRAGNIGATTTAVCSTNFTQTVQHQKYNGSSYVTFKTETAVTARGAIYQPVPQVVDRYSVESVTRNGVDVSHGYTVTGNGTVVIKYFPETYQVIYEDRFGDLTLGSTNGEAYYGETIKGSDIGADTTPSAYYPCYIYTGCTTATVTEKGATVYREFKPIEYNIKYVMNNGVNAAGNPTKVQFGVDFTVKAPTKKGFEFVGWNVTGMNALTSQVGGKMANVSSLTNTKATLYRNLTTTQNGTITFTAVWKDVEPPDLEYTLTNEDGTPYTEGTWTPQDVVMNITSTDEAGIGNITVIQENPNNKVQLDKDLVTGEDKQTSTVSTTFTGTAERDGTIKSTDNYGLYTEIDWGIIKIDQTKPYGEIAYDPATDTNTDVVVKVVEQGDKHSGLHEKAYSWDNGKTWTDDPTFTVKTNDSGTVLIRDAVENQIELEWEITWIDKITPKVSATVTTSNGNDSASYGGKVQTETLSSYNKGVTVWSNTPIKIAWSATDIKSDLYMASGVASIKVYRTNAAFSASSRQQVATTNLSKPTELGKSTSVSYTVNTEGTTYYTVVAEDAVGNKTTTNYTVRYDASKVSFDAENTFINMVDLDNYTSDQIQSAVTNGTPFLSHFAFGFNDANTTGNKVSDTDSSGITKVMFYLYDAKEEATVQNYVQTSINETNLPGLLDEGSGALYDLTDSRVGNVSTSSGYPYDGVYSASIDTFATFPAASELRYILIAYDLAGNRVIYQMASGEVLANFDIKAIIYSSVDDEYNISKDTGNIPYFKTGDMGYVEVWTIGYVDSITFDFHEVGNFAAHEIKSGGLLSKYNLGTEEVPGCHRDIDQSKSIGVSSSAYPELSGRSYANHYVYTPEGWQGEGILIRIPPSYDLNVDTSLTVENEDASYIYQEHSATITANKGTTTVDTDAPYILYSTSRFGIHHRVTYETPGTN